MNTDLLFENARLQGRVITLEALLESERAEVARLKAEVERLGWVSAGSVKFIDHTMELARQATRHHKEMERLKAECQARQAENSVLAVECDSLKAEVERLTKAGDAMAKLLSCCGNPQSEVRGWHAAKGVQS